MRLGFAGLGLMGMPMAANLCRSGAHVTVYNRSPEKAAALVALGARQARRPADLFAAADAAILMLADDAAVDAVLDRGGPGFADHVRGRLIINMGTHAPGWSRQLARDVAVAGGTFVEAPVSGSRGPAEAGDLIAMLAGPPEAVAKAKAILAPMCRELVPVGDVPSAMALKMAVNLYLVGSVAVLSEAAHFAARSGVDLTHLAAVIGEGPLGSSVARAKLAKMIGRDFTPQAAIRDVVKNARLIAESAATAGADAPLLDISRSRFELALATGDGELDMAAVLSTYERSGVPLP
nr:NAD(P)-dependent oxidoreductase [Sphingomonas sp. Y57]